MDVEETEQVKSSPPSNSSQEDALCTSGSDQTQNFPSPTKTDKIRKPRKKWTRVKKQTRHFNAELISLVPTNTPQNVDDNISRSTDDTEGVNLSEQVLTEEPAVVNSEKSNDKDFSNTANEVQNESTVGTTLDLTPEVNEQSCQQTAFQSETIPSATLEKSTGLLVSSCPTPGGFPSVPMHPTRFPMELVHLGPPASPQIVTMGQYYGPSTMIPPFQRPLPQFMEQPRPVIQFVEMPHQVSYFLRPPTSPHSQYRPVLWDPNNNPYNVHPFTNSVMPGRMMYHSFPLETQRKRQSKSSRNRKPRSKVENAQVTNLMAKMQDDETLSTSIKHEDKETMLRKDLAEEEISINNTLVQQNITCDFPQDTIGCSVQEELTIPPHQLKADPISQQDTIMALSEDVPDMCNEVEVESTQLLGEEANDEDLEREENCFSPGGSMNELHLNLEQCDSDHNTSPSPTHLSSPPVKTRRISYKREQVNLELGKRTDVIMKAAKGLFTKRTRTLYTWLYPNTSKREVKLSVSKAWDSLPESEKAYYLAQVDGRLGIHPGLMINPQLEGLVNISEENRPSSKLLTGYLSEEGSTSDYSDATDQHHGDTEEAARAVRSLFATNADSDMWASFSPAKEKVDGNSRPNGRRRKRGGDDRQENMAGHDARGNVEIDRELAKFRQILESDRNLNEEEESYWTLFPEQDPEELFLDLI